MTGNKNKSRLNYVFCRGSSLSFFGGAKLVFQLLNEPHSKKETKDSSAKGCPDIAIKRSVCACLSCKSARKSARRSWIWNCLMGFPGFESFHKSRLSWPLFFMCFFVISTRPLSPARCACKLASRSLRSEYASRWTGWPPKDERRCHPLQTKEIIRNHKKSFIHSHPQSPLFTSHLFTCLNTQLFHVCLRIGFFLLPATSRSRFNTISV